MDNYRQICTSLRPTSDRYLKEDFRASCSIDPPAFSTHYFTCYGYCQSHNIVQQRSTTIDDCQVHNDCKVVSYWSSTTSLDCYRTHTIRNISDFLWTDCNGFELFPNLPIRGISSTTGQSFSLFLSKHWTTRNITVSFFIWVMLHPERCLTTVQLSSAADFELEYS